MFFIFLSCLFRELAAAIILTVQTVLDGQLAGALVAVSLFEIREKIWNTVLVGKVSTYGVEPISALVGAYREGRGEIVEVKLLRLLRRFFEPQAVAYLAS